jgi:hypothetical protein
MAAIPTNKGRPTPTAIPKLSLNSIIKFFKLKTCLKIKLPITAPVGSPYWHLEP